MYQKMKRVKGVMIRVWGEIRSGNTSDNYDDGKNDLDKGENGSDNPNDYLS